MWRVGRREADGLYENKMAFNRLSRFETGRDGMAGYGISCT